MYGRGSPPAQYHENEKRQPQEIARTQNEAVDVNMSGASPALQMQRFRILFVHINRLRQMFVWVFGN